MCEYCEGKPTSKGVFHGKNIKILECANGRRLTECEINKYPLEKEYGIVISHYGLAMGYFNINYCPMCGRDLRGNRNDTASYKAKNHRASRGNGKRDSKG